MLALDRGGACHGMVFRLPGDDPPAEIERLLRRETSYHEDLPSVRWVRARTGGEPLRALAFWVAPRTPGYYIDLPLSEQAARLARAAGHVGSCAAYLRNTVQHLEDLGIRDRYLWRLQMLVAEEIARLDPDAPPPDQKR
jgi:cation transport protein ChaC